MGRVERGPNVRRRFRKHFGYGISLSKKTLVMAPGIGGRCQSLQGNWGARQFPRKEFRWKKECRNALTRKIPEYKIPEHKILLNWVGIDSAGGKSSSHCERRVAEGQERQCVTVLHKARALVWSDGHGALTAGTESRTWLWGNHSTLPFTRNSSVLQKNGYKKIEPWVVAKKAFVSIFTYVKCCFI